MAEFFCLGCGVGAEVELTPANVPAGAAAVVVGGVATGDREFMLDAMNDMRRTASGKPDADEGAGPENGAGAIENGGGGGTSDAKGGNVNGYGNGDSGGSVFGAGNGYHGDQMSMTGTAISGSYPGGNAAADLVFPLYVTDGQSAVWHNMYNGAAFQNPDTGGLYTSGLWFGTA